MTKTKPFDPLIPNRAPPSLSADGLTDQEQKDAELRSRDAVRPVPQPPTEPTPFEKSVAEALLGLENALDVLYWRMTGGFEQKEPMKVDAGIRICRAANERIRAMLGAELRPPTDKNGVSHLRWPATKA